MGALSYIFLFQGSIYRQTFITGIIMVAAIVIDRFTHGGGSLNRKKSLAKKGN